MGRHRRRRRGRWVRVALTAVAGLAAVGVSVVVFVPGRSKAAPRQPQVLSDAVAKKVAALGGGPGACGGAPAAPVRVIGYRRGGGKPISCRNTVTAFGARQLEFDCRAFTNGTSGGPFLAGVDPSTGRGTVVGVIGGYQTGGNDPDVSYSISFGGDVRALYQTAVAKG